MQPYGSIRGPVLLSLSSTAAGAAVAFISHVLFARWLGPTNYGAYAFALSWLAIAQIVALFGLPRAIVRFGSIYYSESDSDSFSSLRAWSLRVLCISVPATCAGVVLYSVLVYEGEKRGLLLAVAAVLPFVALSLLERNFLAALGRPAEGVALERFVRPVLLLLVAAVLFASATDLPSPFILIALYGLSFAAIGTIAYLRGSWTWRTSHVVSGSPLSKKWREMLLPTLFTTGMYVLLANVDRIMLGDLVGIQAVAPYNAACKVAALVTFMLQAFNAVLSPRIPALYERGQLATLRLLLARAARIVFAWNIVALLFLIVFGESILGLFGEEFRSGVVVLRTVLIGQTVSSACGSVGLLLNLTGNHVVVLRVMSGAVFLNLILNIAMIPTFGPVGAAAATAIATIFWNVMLLIYARRRVGVSPAVL